MTTWPKTFPPLTAAQEIIRDDFVQAWLQELGGRSRYNLVNRFNHRYPVDHAPISFTRTLEIGAGLGDHLTYESLTPAQRAEYYALDLRENITAELQRRVPDIHALTADCQKRLPFDDEVFDRVLAIHVLEHLTNLPAALREVRRVMMRTGTFSVVIPCEGSLAYSLARRLSAQRLWQRRYPGEDYRWFIEREHVNLAHEVIAELEQLFVVRHRQFFPVPVPMEWCNLAIGLTLTPK